MSQSRQFNYLILITKKKKKTRKMPVMFNLRADAHFDIEQTQQQAVKIQFGRFIYWPTTGNFPEEKKA